MHCHCQDAATGAHWCAGRDGGAGRAAVQPRPLAHLPCQVGASWEATEFVVRSYKDQMGVFVLGGVDEVLTLREETSLYLP